MEKSRSIAGIIGPTLIVMVVSELRIWNPGLYDEQIVPLVYLSGILMFIAGVSIVRSHHIWALNWTVTITLLGWFSIFLGLLRAFFPQLYKANFKNDLSALIVEIALICLGIFLTLKAYWRRGGEPVQTHKN